jgi:hypothetical protein
MQNCDCKACLVLEAAREGEVPLRLSTDTTGYFSAEIGYWAKPEASIGKRTSLDEVIDWIIRHEVANAPDGLLAQRALNAGYHGRELLVAGVEIPVGSEGAVSNREICDLGQVAENPNG